jgi:predicted transcriptional regulator
VTANALAQNAPRRAQALDRDARALALRSRGLSFRAIGQELGISHVAAQKCLRRAIDRAVQEINENAPAVRAREAALLDEAARAILPKVMEGDVRAQDTLLRNRQRYAALLGLDLKPPDVTVDASQNVIVLPAWGEQPPVVDGEARELGSDRGITRQADERTVDDGDDAASD